jgi:hypothetical protein
MSTATQIPSYSEELKTLQNQLGNMLPKEALSVF